MSPRIVCIGALCTVILTGCQLSSAPSADSLRSVGLLGSSALLAQTVELEDSSDEEEENVPTDECLDAINGAMAREQRMYRRVLFGIEKAEEAEALSVRYDNAGAPWIKADDNRWQQTSDFDDFSNAIRDDEMDEELEQDMFRLPEDASTGRSSSDDEEPFRRGIFETKRVLTSALVPELTQSFRALQCRTTMVCQLAYQSVGRPEEEPVTIEIEVPGCVRHEIDSMLACHTNETLDITVAKNHCQKVAARLVEREQELLKLAVAYDASYRSSLQWAGIVDDALQAFPDLMMGTLRRAADIIPKISRVPCFAGSCDSAPPPENNLRR